MADAGARRHDAEIVEGLLAPAQEGIALPVALIFPGHVLGEGGAIAEGIDHDRMIDDEIDGGERVDLARIVAHRLHRVAHGREIDHRRHAGEILHQHPRRPEGDLAIGALRLQPARHGLDILGADRAAILVAQEILEQHLEGERQAGDVAEPVFLRSLEAEIIETTRADLERPARLETVQGGHGEISLRRSSGRRMISPRFRFSPPEKSQFRLFPGVLPPQPNTILWLRTKPRPRRGSPAGLCKTERPGIVRTATATPSGCLYQPRAPRSRFHPSGARRSNFRATAFSPATTTPAQKSGTLARAKRTG